MDRSTKEGITILVILAIAAVLVYWYTGDEDDDAASDGATDGGTTDGTTTGSTGAQDVSSLTYTGTLIQTSEGEQLTAYPDAGGYSIGFGHHGSDVYAGETIDDAQAEAYLQQDVSSAVATVQKYVNVPLTQDQFNGLVDFVYNLGGVKAAAGSVFDKVNAGDFSGVVTTLEQYVYSGGQYIASLLPRRVAEAAGFSQ